MGNGEAYGRLIKPSIFPAHYSGKNSFAQPYILWGTSIFHSIEVE